MNDLVKFFGSAQPPATDDLVKNLSALASAKTALMGKALLRLTKTGQWVFGADSDEYDGTPLVANPASFASGYVAWYQGQKEGEHMQPLSMGPVDPQSLEPVKSGTVPPGAKEVSGRGWENQFSLELVSRHDTPVHLLYATAAVGGTRALLTLAGDIAYAIIEDPRRSYPLIKLGVDSYKHKQYGTVFTPLLEITGWLDAEGNDVTDRKKLV